MRRTRIAAGLAALLMALTAFAHAEEAVTPNSELPMPKFMKNVAVHDPSIIKADDGWYYIYGSHMAAAKSADLIDWKLISRDASNGGDFNGTIGIEAAVSAGAADPWDYTTWLAEQGRYYYDQAMAAFFEIYGAPTAE